MIDCAIVGGGISGLVAATSLAQSGLSVSLFESKPHFGGRVYSFTDTQSGEQLDNGQHILMGCYTHTLQFLQQIEAQHLLRPIRNMRLPFIDVGRETVTLRMRQLPYPFDALSAFLTYAHITVKERLSLFRVLQRTAFLSKEDLRALDAVSVQDWLHTLNQSPDAIRCLWEPITLATMNTTTGNASAYLFAIVIKEALLSGKEASTFLLPETDLSAVFVHPAVRTIEQHNARIHPHTRITQISQNENGFLLHSDSKQFASRTVILALPPRQLETLLNNPEMRLPCSIAFPRFIPSQIISVHVWCTQPLTTELMTGCLGTTIQWVFDKGQQGTLSRYSLTISAADSIEYSDTGSIERLIREELCALYPHVSPDDIVRVKIIRERNATFVPGPGLDTHRPGTETGIPGLMLAGDWTATSLPATIEGAARSAHSAAVAIRHFFRLSPGIQR